MKDVPELSVNGKSENGYLEILSEYWSSTIEARERSNIEDNSSNYQQTYKYTKSYEPFG